jgi:uncharacterized protein YcnI
MRPLSRFLVPPVLAAISVLTCSSVAAAHTESDLVAVPAGAPATVTLKPTHGCGESPTVEVAIRAPVAGATAGAVEGWTTSQTDDGQGNTILEWTGGVLPATEVGAFPVSFTAPDAVGELLTFPSIQTCEDGAELSWISGDPEAEFPAPRLLVLPAGSEPATSIDDVPADAPGRDQITAIVDIDNPAAETTVPAETTTTAGPATSSAPSSAVATSVPTETSPSDQDGDGDDGTPTVAVLVGAGLVVLAGLGVWIVRRRSA